MRQISSGGDIVFAVGIGAERAIEHSTERVGETDFERVSERLRVAAA